jgi:octaprenyl-diphosphate synthase
MMRDYGMNLGIAFQLIDDVLDFTSSEDVLGKPAGADLIEGKISLPLILLLQREPDMRLQIQTIINDGGYERVARKSLLKVLADTGTLALAQERAIEYAEAARASLNGLVPSAHSAALAAISAYITIRDR